MRKIIAASLACLLCSSAAFGTDAPGFTAGFSRDDAKNVVTDSVYKLMWQDGEEIYQGTYDEAVKYCENLTFAGFEDWRLPTFNELLSITDDTRFEPAINKAFKNIAYETNDKGEKSYGRYRSSTRYAYRSSTRYAYDSSRAWLVDFWFGGVGWSGVSYRYFVRCVRDY